jgi:ABC-type Fe3+ transport system substrate-binding protein
MIPIYSKLFNFIFDKGVVPVSWSVGVITLIFKKKGNSKDPKNYKSFTLMRYLGKVFTGILNNRLASLSDDSK